jgi:vesicle coat complex subunit
VPLLVPIVLLELKKGMTDIVPHVRRTVCKCIPKLYHTSPDHSYDLMSMLGALLNDKSPLVVGTAISVLYQCFPHRYDLMHGVYRRACRSVLLFDEWDQVDFLDYMVEYTRKHFVDPRVEMADDLKLLVDSIFPLLGSMNSAVFEMTRLFRELLCCAIILAARSRSSTQHEHYCGYCKVR